MPQRKQTSRKRRKPKRPPYIELGFWLIVLITVVSGGLLRNFPWALLLLGLAVVAILVSIGVAVMVRSILKQQKRRVQTLSVAHIDQMTGTEFERYLVPLLKFKGFTFVELTRASGDYGIDITARKDGVGWGIQTKRYGEKLTQKPVQEVVAGIKNYPDLTRAMVIANRHFTLHARISAGNNKCELIDRDVLADWIAEFQAAK